MLALPWYDALLLCVMTVVHSGRHAGTWASGLPAATKRSPALIGAPCSSHSLP
ncbi:hypothetical protein M3J09_009786 [Ascochyta lentis]